METSVFVELERAELAARERRLAAEEEAGRLVAAAQDTARALERAVDGRIAAAIAGRRRSVLKAAAAEIRQVEQEMARVEPSSAVLGDDPAFRAAVELVVAGVLAEDPAAEG